MSAKRLNLELPLLVNLLEIYKPKPGCENENWKWKWKFFFGLELYYVFCLAHYIMHSLKWIWKNHHCHKTYLCFLDNFYDSSKLSSILHRDRDSFKNSIINKNGVPSKEFAEGCPSYGCNFERNGRHRIRTKGRECHAGVCLSWELYFGS